MILTLLCLIVGGRGSNKPGVDIPVENHKMGVIIKGYWCDFSDVPKCPKNRPIPFLIAKMLENQNIEYPKIFNPFRTSSDPYRDQTSNGNISKTKPS